LILADEPTGNLDSKASDDVLAIFKGLTAGGRAVVLVTHDTHVAATADRVLHLDEGRIVDEKAAAAPS
jgi:putative ABC transport system ATP-binding protein